MFSYLLNLKWSLFFILFSPGLHAQVIQISDVVPQVNYVDQHDRTQIINADTKLLLFSQSKSTGSMMADILADVEPGHMQRIQAAYVADISGMPSLISRFIALPKMREISEPILVVRDPDQVAWIPKKERKITLIVTQDGLVSNIIYSDNEEEIRELLSIPLL